MKFHLKENCSINVDAIGYKFKINYWRKHEFQSEQTKSNLKNIINGVL